MEHPNRLAISGVGAALPANKDYVGSNDVIRTPGVGHHPPSLPHPESIVSFILSHAK